MRLYSPAVEVTAVFSETHEKFQKTLFLNEPKTANSDQSNLWQKKIHSVQDPWSYRFFFRLAVSGDEQFAVYFCFVSFST